MFAKKALVIGVFLMVESASLFAQKTPTYEVIVATLTAPYTRMEAHGVNDLRHFHGGAQSSSGTTFFFWTPDGGVVPLKAPHGEFIEIADINNLDQLAVNTTTGPYIWSPAEGWRSLVRDTQRNTTRITSLNDKGQMVGYSFDGDGGLKDVTRHAVSWSRGGSLRVVKSSTQAVPAQINEHQDVVATAYKTNGAVTEYEAVLSTHVGSYLKLGDHPDNGRGRFSVAVGVAENDVVALNSLDDNGTMVACVWTAGRGVRPLELGESSAVGISRRGTIVGNTTSYVFAWNAGWGSIDVSQHLADNSPAIQNLHAFGVSGRGSIAGSAIIDGVVSAVVLVPSAP
jgi:hypothetical protein